MKKLIFLQLAFLLSLFFISCSNAPESDKAATTDSAAVAQSSTAESLKVDTTASKLEWVATKVSGIHTGVVPIKSGEMQIKDGNLVAGNFVVLMKELAVTGPKENDEASNKKLLKHLQSKDFFEVDTHPEAVFQITDVKPFSGTVKDSTDPRQNEISKYKVLDPTHTISGNLTIKDVTKNISFPAKVSITGESLTALAKFNINRKDWNIVYPGKPDDLIRDEIHLGISVKAAK
jgi:polyisoprenoid-binding protein YceI